MGYTVVGGSEPTQIYGASDCPYLLGSGGGEGNLNAAGGTGGGAMASNVIGDATVDGDIVADGAAGILGTSTYGSGGGSGGSIYLKADNIAGSGNVFYSGNPTVQKAKSVGSGSIRKKG